VKQAVANINTIIGPALLGLDPTLQKEIDELMVHKLDGTQNEWGWCKKKLGANAILAVSLAVCKAGADAAGLALYEHIAALAGNPTDKMFLPVPAFNVINGGSHAGNKLAMQEFMILPVGASSFSEVRAPARRRARARARSQARARRLPAAHAHASARAPSAAAAAAASSRLRASAQAMRMGAEVYHTLKGVIKAKYGQDATNVGDEGGFAPNIQDNAEGLELLVLAIRQAGYEGKVKIGMDVAASEFFTKGEDAPYDLDFKSAPNDGSKKLSAPALAELYEKFAADYPVISVEDPFDQDDWEAYAAMTAKVGSAVQVVGDDLLVTNPTRVAKAIEAKACNALLLKVNQIGSVTESIEAVAMAKKAGWGVMASHRSGETEDSFIADMAVGLATGQIKTGAPCRSERLAKYNQLLRIEEELGERAVYTGEHFRLPPIAK
jgi:enolase